MDGGPLVISGDSRRTVKLTEHRNKVHLTELEVDDTIVMLPGAGPWAHAYRWGEELETVFPDQCGEDFAMAVRYVDEGPLKNWHIRNLELVDVLDIDNTKVLQEGMNDEQRWIWLVTLQDESQWEFSAGCDYTGWDCQAWGEWKQRTWR